MSAERGECRLCVNGAESHSRPGVRFPGPRPQPPSPACQWHERSASSLASTIHGCRKVSSPPSPPPYYSVFYYNSSLPPPPPTLLFYTMSYSISFTSSHPLSSFRSPVLQDLSHLFCPPFPSFASFSNLSSSPLLPLPLPFFPIPNLSLASLFFPFLPVFLPFSLPPPSTHSTSRVSELPRH